MNKTIITQSTTTKAFIEHRGKVLIIREAAGYKDGTNKGRYDVPGGRIKSE